MKALHTHVRCGLPQHETTCADCLVWFHTAEGIEKHKQVVHHRSPSRGDSDRVENEEPHTESREQVRRGEGVRAVMTLPNGGRSGPQPGSESPQTSGAPLHSLLIAPARQILPGDITDSDDSDSESVFDSGVATEVQPDPWETPSVPLARNEHTESYARRVRENIEVPNPANFVGRGRRLDSSLLASMPRALLPALDNQIFARPDETSEPRSRTAKEKAKQQPEAEVKVHIKKILGTKSKPRKTNLAVQCPLCLERATNLATTACGHVGCGPCLVTSVKAKPECPICRNPVTLLELHPIYL